ncbi:MAG: TauD/TfdA family dioxygenase [Acetobacteraceae bacterium]
MLEIPKSPVTGPSVWTGATLAARSEWERQFDVPSLAELDGLLAAAKADTITGALVERFPSLAALLSGVHDELVHGSGVVLLHGFPATRYTDQESAVLYLALGRLMGTPISQNSYGDLLGHVRDEGKRTTVIGNTTGARGYLSNEKLLFHTDLGDTVGLLCLQKAVEGGISSVSSSMMVFNEILKIHPEYLPAYFDGFAFRSTEADGAPTEWRLPVYTCHRGLLSCAIRRVAIETTRLNGFPYTDLENAALDFFDSTSARPDLRYDMCLEPGDIQFLNNYITLHSRTNFVDAEDPRLKRHLLRLWLQFPDGRSFMRCYPTLYDGIPATLPRA